MQISGTAASGADRQFASEMRFGPGCERCRLLMADMHPLNLLSAAHRIGNSVERIAAHAVDPLNARFQQNIYKQVRYFLCHLCSFRTQKRPLEQTCLRYFRPANQATCTLPAGWLEVALLESRWAPLSTCTAPGSCLR